MSSGVDREATTETRYPERGVPVSRIQAYCREIAAKFDPERIILFGSRARDEASPGSDVDLLVVMEFDGRAVDKAYEIRRSTGTPFSIDLLVRRPSDLHRRINLGDSFLREIVESGKELYERSRS